MPVALGDHLKHIPSPSLLMCNISLTAAIFCVNRRFCIPNVDIFSGLPVEKYRENRAKDQICVKCSCFLASCNYRLADYNAYRLHNTYKHVVCFERFHKFSDDWTQNMVCYIDTSNYILWLWLCFSKQDCFERAKNSSGISSRSCFSC